MEGPQGLEPWEACGNLVRTWRAPDGSGGFLVAECPANTPDSIVNARTIAAAPTALLALRGVVEDADEWEGRTGHRIAGGWLELARIALAQADGT
jgi:hypothetical protein